jgi:hypothetical protein
MMELLMKNLTKISASFHQYSDTKLKPRQFPAVEIAPTKYVLIRERELSYRFQLHQHAYVQQLMQRLIQKGTTGLQAADTEYVPGDASLPGSVEIALKKNAKITIPTASGIALLGKTQATAEGVPIELDPGKDQAWKIKMGGDTQVNIIEGLKVILAEGITSNQQKGTIFPLAITSKGFVSHDTKIGLDAGAAIILHDGTLATLTTDTEVLLGENTELNIPAGTQVQLLRSKPLPVLFTDFFDSAYQPNRDMVQHSFPVKDLDFTSGGAYSVYNWEVFFHVPLTIAIHLSKNQRFAEAQQWFHYLFDPTDDSDGPTPERFWKVHPFRYTDVKKMEEVLSNLATGEDKSLQTETINSIEAWEDNPFRPHAIARYRPQSYMYKTVMAYLDNLIAWGDSLFRQDTGEAIDEALMLYVLAANILGPRPQPVPKKGTVRPQTYAALRGNIARFGTVLQNMEAELPFNLMPFPADKPGNNDHLVTLRSLGKTLYFCVPRNDKLLSYWDTVADRLFKIRNSLNFQGTFRQLALFEPPIDPGLLARASASGVDVGAVANGLNQPLPLVRFPFVIQKAAEIVQEVKALGSNLLSAMEKEDGEAMAVLRAKQERVVMAMVEQVRYAQLQEAIKSREGLLKTLALAIERYTYYERQLGKEAAEIEQSIPQLEELDKESLEKLRFAMNEPAIGVREITVDIAQSLGESGGKIMSSYEAEEMEKLAGAREAQEMAAAKDREGAYFGLLIPDLSVNLEPMGVGASTTLGGSIATKIFSYRASFDRANSEKQTYESGMAAKIGSYSLRQQDWSFQSNLAAGEIQQIFVQLRAAQIREAIAEMELANHQQQITHAEEIERFLNEEGNDKTGKKTNKAFYSWMKREAKDRHAQCFQLAFDISRKAERALQHELGNPELSYLQFGYLAGKEGLLAGEKLYLDVKRMEMAYHDLNQREYELTKHISLLQADPLALIRLRKTGRCTVRLPEELFDMDGPGHYFRRIKTVAVSIPCVAGPYASINCSLTLLKSTIRKTPILRNDIYGREDAEDDRFADYYGSFQSVVTSSAQNDSGLFETNLRDERYLPFENSGVISEWQLELPANPSNNEPCQFDYGTISDVILHLRYTAREGGGLLRKGALDNFKALMSETKLVGTTRLFSVRHEFPSEWAQFQGNVPATNQRPKLELNLRAEHYPFWSQGHLNSVSRVDLYASNPKDLHSLDVFDATARNAAARKETLTRDAVLGNLLVGKFSNETTGFPLPERPECKLQLFFENKDISDLWIGVTWRK